jgi:hypothetical protein
VVPYASRARAQVSRSIFGTGMFGDVLEAKAAASKADASFQYIDSPYRIEAISTYVYFVQPRPQIIPLSTLRSVRGIKSPAQVQPRTSREVSELVLTCNRKTAVMKNIGG